MQAAECRYVSLVPGSKLSEQQCCGADVIVECSDEEQSHAHAVQRGWASPRHNSTAASHSLIALLMAGWFDNIYQPNTFRFRALL